MNKVKEHRPPLDTIGAARYLNIPTKLPRKASLQRGWTRVYKTRRSSPI